MGQHTGKFIGAGHAAPQLREFSRYGKYGEKRHTPHESSLRAYQGATQIARIAEKSANVFLKHVPLDMSRELALVFCSFAHFYPKTGSH
ncbi:MAG: hypothetical protein KDA46_09305, partial [Parvularculaceae bacterium]|nr:hypothetical protein [Parvularculaceae bacterium]